MVTASCARVLDDLRVARGKSYLRESAGARREHLGVEQCDLRIGDARLVGGAEHARDGLLKPEAEGVRGLCAKWPHERSHERHGKRDNQEGRRSEDKARRHQDFNVLGWVSVQRRPPPVPVLAS
jgi:hypothetical protein